MVQLTKETKKALIEERWRGDEARVCFQQRFLVREVILEGRALHVVRLQSFHSFLAPNIGGDVRDELLLT